MDHDGLARQDDRPASSVFAFNHGYDVDEEDDEEEDHDHDFMIIYDDDHNIQGSLGGGVIQTTASESTFVCLLAGRSVLVVVNVVDVVVVDEIDVVHDVVDVVNDVDAS